MLQRYFLKLLLPCQMSMTQSPLPSQLHFLSLHSPRSFASPAYHLSTIPYHTQLQTRSQSQVVRIFILHILANPKHDRAISQSATQFPLNPTNAALRGQTHLNITSPFATKFATPIYIVGHGALGTTYFSTKTVTPPAMPPAKLAKPRNRTTRAFQATPLPE